MSDNSGEKRLLKLTRDALTSLSVQSTLKLTRDVITGPTEEGTPDPFANFTNGMIFEFDEMEQARAFAATVKSRFHLDGRVFDNVEDAYRVHMNPFVQNPPVAHIDRPYWELPSPCTDKAWDEAFEIETKIEKLASKFGGTFIGT